MGRKALSQRDIWQADSLANSDAAEKRFFEAFKSEFSDTHFRVRLKPQEFINVYRGIELTKATLSEIYTPNRIIRRHGFEPDYAIDNLTSNKTLYVEKKRQDGWVEGGIRSDGRGNAHERGCKYFTPGLQKIMRAHGHLGDDVLPFWSVFQGNITRDPCRVREITCWYEDHPAHFFMWRNPDDPLTLIDHFNKYLKHLLI